MPLNGFDYSVSWSDFTSVPSRPSGQNEDAHIYPQMSFGNFKLARKGTAVIITDVDVTVSVVSADSWVVSTKTVNELLKHEQGHYDILAVIARNFYKSLKGKTAPSVFEINELVKKMYTDAQANFDTIQRARYDTQTNHGQDKTMQQIWNQKIDAVKKNPNGTINDLPQ